MRTLTIATFLFALSVVSQLQAATPPNISDTHQIPASSTFSGLSRKVIEYSERFYQVMDALKQPDIDESIWAPLESLVDTKNFQRQGVFTEQQTEKFGWETYKQFVQNYAAGTHWEGTLRYILEEGRMVVLGLEERSTHGGITMTAKTVTVYWFNDNDKLVNLEVYVMPLGQEGGA